MTHTGQCTHSTGRGREYDTHGSVYMFMFGSRTNDTHGTVYIYVIVTYDK